MVQNNRRLPALLMCIGLVLALFVSFACILSGIDHSCTGHDCDICRHIAKARALLNSFVLYGVPVLLTMAALIHSCLFTAGGNALPAQETLVGWRVRLNN